MSITYSVLITTKEVNDWLESEGVTANSIRGFSRYPTPREIMEVLNSLSGYHVRYFSGSVSWQANVSELANSDGKRVCVVVPENLKEDSDFDMSRMFYFENGDPELMIQILKGLSALCGPLVLVHGSEKPIVVTSG